MKKVLLVIVMLSLSACTVQEDVVVSSIPATTYLAENVYPNTTVHTVSQKPFESLDRNQRDLVRSATVFIGHGYEDYVDLLETEQRYFLQDHEPDVQEDTVLDVEQSRYNWLNPLTIRRLGIELGIPQETQDELARIHNTFTNQTRGCSNTALSISSTPSHLLSEQDITITSLYGDEETVASPSQLTSFTETSSDYENIIHVEGFSYRTTQQIANRANIDIQRVNTTVTNNYVEDIQRIQTDIIQGLRCN